MRPLPILRISGLPVSNKMYPTQQFQLTRTLSTNYISTGIAFLLQMSCASGANVGIPVSLTTNAATEFITTAQAAAIYTLTAVNMLTSPLTVCTFSALWDTSYPEFAVSSLGFNGQAAAQYPTYQVTIISSPVINFINFPTQPMVVTTSILNLGYNIVSNTFINGARLILIASAGTFSGGANTMEFYFFPGTNPSPGPSFSYKAPTIKPVSGIATISAVWSDSTYVPKIDGPFCYHGFNGGVTSKTQTFTISFV
jgi:hypothetical protein